MARDIANKKHYPPAYRKYRKSHPTISIVLTKELKDFLDRQKRDAGMSYSQLVKRFIDRAYDSARARSQGYEEGYEKGYTQGLNKYRTISLGECSCGEPLVFHLDNPEEVGILTEIVSDSGIVHEDCPPKPIIVRMPPLWRCQQCGEFFSSDEEAIAHCHEKGHTWERI